MKFMVMLDDGVDTVGPTEIDASSIMFPNAYSRVRSKSLQKRFRDQIVQRVLTGKS